MSARSTSRQQVDFVEADYRNQVFVTITLERVRAEKWRGIPMIREEEQRRGVLSSRGFLFNCETS